MNRMSNLKTGQRELVRLFCSSPTSISSAFLPRKRTQKPGSISEAERRPHQAPKLLVPWLPSLQTPEESFLLSVTSRLRYFVTAAPKA